MNVEEEFLVWGDRWGGGRSGEQAGVGLVAASEGNFVGLQCGWVGVTGLSCFGDEVCEGCGGSGNGVTFFLFWIGEGGLRRGV